MRQRNNDAYSLWSVVQPMGEDERKESYSRYLEAVVDRREDNDDKEESCRLKPKAWSKERNVGC